MASQDERRKQLKSLANRFSMETDYRDHYSNSGEEDLAEYLHDRKPIGRYVTVTSTDEFTYLYPCESFEAASEKAVENIADDIYPEAPAGIYDLDDETVCYVKRVHIDWAEPKPIPAH